MWHGDRKLPSILPERTLEREFVGKMSKETDRHYHIRNCLADKQRKHVGSIGVVTTSILTDDELVLRCKRELPDDTHSYELLVQRHMNRVYSIAYRIVCNKEEAEDITQEVFVKVFNGLKKFEQQASFSSWIYRIATNSALDSLDKLKRQQKTVSPFTVATKEKEEESDPLYFQPSKEVGPEENALQRELRECISRVLRQLDRQQSSLLIMRDFNDLSYDEIAATLKVKLSAVKMRIHRARLAFQELFSNTCGRDHLLSFASNGDGTATGGNGKAKKG